eukprot:gnl/TRDRNA2_/TRDRNA2_174781_c0_seq1.p1 gnl/TRDRNA2_/TRDRNA2_174781_c0~~gnl/TRDRNA2_/TRDRNA2_174781_c0_seq1.p1  ORF type:complete len:222 (+),score=30.54 gnl/TRDRNA2_/TRDRNA2_174781_c0_seq1:84-749(+)
MWRCRSCGFKNQAANLVCGGTGSLGCKKPQTLKTEAQSVEYGSAAVFGKAAKAIGKGAARVNPYDNSEAESAALGGSSMKKARGFKTQLCTFFEKGRCTKGSECPYAHGAEQVKGTRERGSALMNYRIQVNGVATLPGATTSSASTSDAGRCPFFYMFGSCEKGASCLLSHDKSGSGSSGSTDQEKCTMFEFGLCTKGLSCPYLHDMSKDADSGTSPFLKW